MYSSTPVARSVLDVTKEGIVASVEEAARCLKFQFKIEGPFKDGTARITGPFEHGNVIDAVQIGAGSNGTVYRGGDFVYKHIHEASPKEALGEMAISLLTARTQIGPAMPKVAGGRLVTARKRRRADMYLTIMEGFEGDISKLFDQHMSDLTRADVISLENQVRERVRALLTAGIICIDVKAQNCLYNYIPGNRPGNRIQIALADFDSGFCCTASKAIFDQTVNRAAREVEPTLKGDLFHSFTMDDPDQSCDFRWSAPARGAAFDLSCAQIGKDIIRFKARPAFKAFIKRCGVPFANEMKLVSTWLPQWRIAERVMRGHKVSPPTKRELQQGGTVLRVLLAFWGTADHYETLSDSKKLLELAKVRSPPRTRAQAKRENR